MARLDRKARKIAAILEISRALNEEHHPSVLFQLIVDRATELMGASSGSVILVDAKSGILRIEADGVSPGQQRCLVASRASGQVGRSTNV